MRTDEPLKILQSDMAPVLEAVRYGDRALIDKHPELDSTGVLVHFRSTNSRFNTVKKWGTMLQYR